MTREQFELLPSKKKKAYAKMMYARVRKELIEEYWEKDNGFDEGGQRTQCHHCWEKGMGGAIPLWYYFQKNNLILWSLTFHHYYHYMPRVKWTKKMQEEFAKADEIKQAMIDDDRTYRETQGTVN